MKRVAVLRAGPCSKCVSISKKDKRIFSFQTRADPFGNPTSQSRIGSWALLPVARAVTGAVFKNSLSYTSILIIPLWRAKKQITFRTTPLQQLSYILQNQFFALKYTLKHYLLK